MSAVDGALPAGSRPLGERQGLGTRLAVRARLRTVPRAAWACALVMLANGIAWSLITPPFQVPDENAHYAYVQQVAERGTVPRLVVPEGKLSPALDTMLGAVLFYQTVGERENPAPLSSLLQNGVSAAERAPLSNRGNGNALSATNNPPLYYVLEAIPYKLASSGGVLDRLVAMRLLSSLMAAVTVLLIYMFLMELLPGTPWAWATGALVAGFQPLFSFMSGGVNNDNLLYLMAAGLFWALARAFRRGLTPAAGILIGAFVGVGVVTKFTMLGLVPAAGLAILLMLRRAWPLARAAALRGAGWAVAVAGVPVAIYLFLNRFVWDRTAIPGGVGSVSALPGAGLHFSTREELSHIWQLFLPAVGMRHQFTYLPLWKTWFKGFFGRFGWLDYKFPYHFYVLALIAACGIAALALIELWRSRGPLRRHAGELVVYALALVGVCVEIGVESYRETIQTGGFGQFEQARYLLPLLALYAAVAALAARSGRARWGPVLGVVLVTLAIGHDLASQMITVARYYT
jgi:4-amino-4-deoxy-L-arabinose transferase-like glycosyltransferase